MAWTVREAIQMMARAAGETQETLARRMGRERMYLTRALARADVGRLTLGELAQLARDTGHTIDLQLGADGIHVVNLERR